MRNTNPKSKFKPGEDAREKGRRGGIASGKSRKAKSEAIKSLSQTAIDTVTQEDKMAIVKSLINFARRGSTAHITVLADMLGEALTRPVNTDVTVRFESEEDFSK